MVVSRSWLKIICGAVSGTMKLSDHAAASAWIISSFSARPIYPESCDATRAITTTSERIDHWIKMRRSLVQFSGPGASNRSPS